MDRYFLKDLLPTEKSHSGAGEKCKEEEAAEKNHYVLTINFHSLISAVPVNGIKDSKMKEKSRFNVSPFCF